MSATNKTTYYELPVFIATDEPKWLTDWNGAMNIIDGAIAEAKSAADNAQTTANANALAIQGLGDSVSTISTALSTLTTTVNTLNGAVNTINELLGNGTPTTTDKTIIGAINELKAEIDALAPGGAVSAAEVSYDNTTSDLTADDVQEAIDEVSAKIGFPTRLNQGAPQYSADGGLTWANFSSALSIDEVESADTSAESNTETLTYTFLSDHDEVLLIGTGLYRCMNTVNAATVTSYDLTMTPSTTGTGSFTSFHHTKNLLDSAHSGLANEHIFTGRDTYHIENVKAGDVFTLQFDASETLSAGTPSSQIIDCEFTIFTVN